MLPRNPFPFQLTSAPPSLEHDPRPSLALSHAQLGLTDNAFHLIQQGQWKGWNEENLAELLWKQLQTHSSRQDPIPALEMNASAMWPEGFNHAPFWLQGLGSMVQSLSFATLQSMGVVSFALQENLFPILDQLYRKKDGPKENLWVYTPPKSSDSSAWRWDRIQLKQDNFKALQWATLRGLDLSSKMRWTDVRSAAGIELAKRIANAPDLGQLNQLVSQAQADFIQAKNKQAPLKQAWFPLVHLVFEKVWANSSVPFAKKTFVPLLELTSNLGEAQALNEMTERLSLSANERSNYLFRYIFKSLEPLHKNMRTRNNQPTLQMDTKRFFDYLETLQTTHEHNPISRYDAWMGVVELAFFSRPGLHLHPRAPQLFHHINVDAKTRLLNGIHFLRKESEHVQLLISASGWSLMEWVQGAMTQQHVQEVYLESTPVVERQLLGAILPLVENYTCSEGVLAILKDKFGGAKALTHWMKVHGKDHALIPELMQIDLGKTTVEVQSWLIIHAMNLLNAGAKWPNGVSPQTWERIMERYHPNRLQDFQRLYLERSLSLAKPTGPKLRL